jgi:two-component system sensor histidine kinase PilS (NtrC family)
MNLSETERQIRLLMVLRVATVTTLLVSALAIELVLNPGQTLRPLFLLAAAAYGAALLYAALDRRLRGRLAFVYVQVLGDALLVAALVGITGGASSAMTFLFLIPICVAALLDLRRGALTTATFCSGLYALTLLSGNAFVPFGQLVPPAPVASPGQLSYSLLAHLVGFGATALLASHLAERVRSQGRELDERRGAVARLQALNENIIESINSGLLTTDLDGKVNFLNRGGIEITGLAPGSVEGRPVEQVFGLEAGLVRQIRMELLARRRFRFERDWETQDGRLIFLGFAVSNLQDRSGAPLGYIFIFQDLTEIRALEQEVRLKDRMAAMGGMAAGMAHELRNPLAAISGSVQYLKAEIRPQGESLELMDIILRESQRLDQAIKDFLLFARPGVFNPERCNLVRILEDHVKLLTKSREFGRLHNVELIPSSAEIWAEVDPNRIRQIVWNLSTNSLKAMPAGGRLRIHVGIDSDSEEVRLRFEDDGVGMSEGEIAGYFQPFRSAFAEGTGLGAAIVYRLVEEHGGRIALESQRGRGTWVDIRFPRDSKRRSERSEPPLPEEEVLTGGVQR